MKTLHGAGQGQGSFDRLHPSCGGWYSPSEYGSKV